MAKSNLGNTRPYFASTYGWIAFRRHQSPCSCHPKTAVLQFSRGICKNYPGQHGGRMQTNLASTNRIFFESECKLNELHRFDINCWLSTPLIKNILSDKILLLEVRNTNKSITKSHISEKARKLLYFITEITAS